MTDWVVASTFSIGDHWIPAFAESPALFHAAEPRYRHDAWRVRTGAREWFDFLMHAFQAWRLAGRYRRAGIVTVLPQLAIMVGLVKRLTFSRRPLVAWMFNLSRVYDGKKGMLARFSLARVDRFVVHSTHEIDVYSRWLGLPRERFEFVPLSIAEQTMTIEEDLERPFVLAMGQANRDYALLLRVLARTGHRAVIVAPAHLLAGLSVPANVEARSNVPLVECHALCRRARVSIVPLADTATASGQVSVLDAMMLGRPVIATRGVGTVDYIEDHVDGLLVPPSDADALEAAIRSLWNDDGRRRAMGAAARASALSKYTFAAVAPRFTAIVRELSRG